MFFPQICADEVRADFRKLICANLHVSIIRVNLREPEIFAQIRIISYIEQVFCQNNHIASTIVTTTTTR